MSFTIKELESLSGIRAHTIRIWEQRYHFLKPSRTATNIRKYDNEELKTLLTVALLNKYGYKISTINEMQPLQRTEAVLHLQQSSAHHEHVVNQLIGCMVDLNSIEFETILTHNIIEHGMEASVSNLIFVFLERVGILWQTNGLRPVQEHIVSAIIRQKIIRAIDKIAIPASNAPLFVLFLPEGEHHELGLLYVYYLLRKNRLPVIYLGADVPLSDVQYIIQAKSPAYVYLHLSCSLNKQKIQRYMQVLCNAVGSTQIILSGAAARLVKPQPNLQLLQSLKEVQTYIVSV